MLKNNLAKLRGERTQAEVSKNLGISQGIYSMCERGQCLPTPEQLKDIVAELHTTPTAIYPAAILEMVYNITDSKDKPPPKKRATVTVKIPTALAERIDAIVEKGEYADRSDYVTTIIREKIGGDYYGQDAQAGGVVSLPLSEVESV